MMVQQLRRRRSLIAVEVTIRIADPNFFGFSYLLSLQSWPGISIIILAIDSKIYCVDNIVTGT